MNTFYISNDKIKQNCIQFISNLKDGAKWQVKISPFVKKRSVCQNSLYWLFLKEISTQRYESGQMLLPDQAYHLLFRQLFLGTDSTEIEGRHIETLRSTTRLTTKEFTEYLENIELYAGSEWGVGLPHPVELYTEAMK